jgi:hypothetical protein
MPDFIKRPGSATQAHSPAANGHKTEVPEWGPSQSTPAQAGEESSEYGTPTPIAVTRVKKKKRAGEGGKKKRIAPGDGGAP